jgi:putative phosphoesterase
MAVLDELRALGPPVEAVWGNADVPELKSVLPRERVVEVESARIGLVHVPGPRVGREARLRARFPGCEAIVYGHTHRPQVDRFEGTWILNPGSPTERRRAPRRSLLLLDVVGKMLTPRLVPLSASPRRSLT